MAQPKSIRLPEEDWQSLTTRAEAQGTTVHALLKRVVQEYLSSEKTRPTTGLERDVYDLAAGMEALMEEMSKIQAGQEMLLKEMGKVFSRLESPSSRRPNLALREEKSSAQRMREAEGSW